MARALLLLAMFGAGYLAAAQWEAVIVAVGVLGAGLLEPSWPGRKAPAPQDRVREESWF